jgi:hypothetical protein
VNDLSAQDLPLLIREIRRRAGWKMAEKKEEEGVL